MHHVLEKFYDISMSLLQKSIEYFTLFSGSLPENDKNLNCEIHTYCLTTKKPHQSTKNGSVLMIFVFFFNLLAYSASSLSSGRAGIS